MIVLCIVMTACDTSSKTTDSILSENSNSILSDASSQSSSETTSIVFPNNEFGKTESNAEIFKITPFNLNISFPKDWKVVYPKTEDEAGLGLSPVKIYAGDKYVCSVSYMTFKINDNSTDENFYRSVYSDLITNMVTWDNDYTVVKEDDNNSVATCNVLINSPMGEITFPGILSYNKELLVYITISFENCEIDITHDILSDIAKSVSITK